MKFIRPSAAIASAVARAAALVVLALPLAAMPAPAHAQEFFEVARDFVVDTSCSAYGSFKKQSDATVLEVGRMYPGRGVNRRNDPTHVFARVGDTSKWIALSCGHFSDRQAAFPDGMASGGRASRRGADVCLPFFDDVDNPVAVGFGGNVDITPKAPDHGPFDVAIAEACGAFGSEVTRDTFKSLLDRHPDVLDRVKAFTGGRTIAGGPTHAERAAYRDALAEVWFGEKTVGGAVQKAEGFVHIMCGERKGRSIGGLHLAERYQFLQDRQMACRMDNLQQNEVVPGVIYTMGASVRLPDGTELRHSTKGYGLTLSGEDLLKLATRAFVENPEPGDDSNGCMLSVQDDGKSFSAVMVRRSYGIRTIYPDATPGGRRDQRNPPCAAPISLQ